MSASGDGGVGEGNASDDEKGSIEIVDSGWRLNQGAGSVSHPAPNGSGNFNLQVNPVLHAPSREDEAKSLGILRERAREIYDLVVDETAAQNRLARENLQADAEQRRSLQKQNFELHRDEKRAKIRALEKNTDLRELVTKWYLPGYVVIVVALAAYLEQPWVLVALAPQAIGLMLNPTAPEQKKSRPDDDDDDDDDDKK